MNIEELKKICNEAEKYIHIYGEYSDAFNLRFDPQGCLQLLNRIEKLEGALNKILEADECTIYLCHGYNIARIALKESDV
jgi:hypothetical protein